MAKKLAPVHLGEVLREEFLKALDLSPYAVAAAIRRAAHARGTVWRARKPR